MPLILAYALTIHKVQGSTVDRAQMNLNSVFEYGQAYVALSRIRSLESLCLENSFPEKCVKAHPKALQFYETLRKIPDATWMQWEKYAEEMQQARKGRAKKKRMKEANDPNVFSLPQALSQPSSQKSRAQFLAELPVEFGSNCTNVKSDYFTTGKTSTDVFTDYASQRKLVKVEKPLCQTARLANGQMTAETEPCEVSKTQQPPPTEQENEVEPGAESKSCMQQPAAETKGDMQQTSGLIMPSQHQLDAAIRVLMRKGRNHDQALKLAMKYFSRPLQQTKLTQVLQESESNISESSNIAPSASFPAKSQNSSNSATPLAQSGTILGSSSPSHTIFFTPPICAIHQLPYSGSVQISHSLNDSESQNRRYIFKCSQKCRFQLLQ